MIMELTSVLPIYLIQIHFHEIQRMMTMLIDEGAGGDVSDQYGLTLFYWLGRVVV